MLISRQWRSIAGALMLTAAPGAMAQTAWNEFNSSQRTVVFDTGTAFAGADSFKRAVINLDLACPSAGKCGSWDVQGFVELKQPDGNWIHVARFITPYGVPATYSFDVTDLQPIFAGRSKVPMRVTIDIWEGAPKGWIANWSYSVVAGTPEPRPVAVVPLWNDAAFNGASQAEYGKSAATAGSLPAVPDKTVTLPANASKFKIRTLVTGHGQGDAHNAAEFYDNNHAITWAKHPSTLNARIWRTDCATSTVSPQKGTYTYSRAGWCPGGVVQPWLSADLAPNLPAPGSQATFHYQVDYGKPPYVNQQQTYDNNGHTMPFYNVSAVLIGYQ